MKIYINNQLVKAEILPSNTPTRDETLETFSFALLSNTNPLPLAPMQKVKVDFKGDNTDVAYFYIISDSVETYSLNPLRYKHNLSCIQNTRALSKHLVRNSSFTQPFYLLKSSFNTEKRYWRRDTWGDEGDGTTDGGALYVLNEYSEPLHLAAKEILTKATLKIAFQHGDGGSGSTHGNLYSYDHNADDVNSHLPSPYSPVTLVEHFTLKYTDANNQIQTMAITPATLELNGFDFNSTADFPIVVELAKQGCNNFEILFDTEDMVQIDGIVTGQIMFWMMQVSIEAQVYYYNCYDILELLINRQKKETSINTNPLPLFTLPQSGDLYDLLTKTIAPNFTFTDLTLYECVADVFRVFDAIFTMDENGVLGIEYFNDLSGEKIVNQKFTGRTLSLGEDKYTNGLVANYQDARIVERFPNDNGYTHLRSSELGVPEATDHNLITPHNIENVIKCELVIDGLEMKYRVDRDPDHDIGNIYNGEMTIDVTRYILEQSAWTALEEGNMSNEDYLALKMKKTNCLYYVKGDNKIQCAFSFKDNWGLNQYVMQYMANTELVRLSKVTRQSRCNNPNATTNLRGKWYDVKMRITYMATADGKTRVESLTNKYEGETLIDQNNGAVDLNKMGLNMLGTILKLGNPTLNATHRITSWSKRVKQGQIYEWQGRTWLANVVNYTFFKGMLQGKISFVQNFNQLALRTKLLREKRMSNISRELVQKSEEIITDYIYFSSDTIGNASEEQTIHFDKTKLKEFIYGTFRIQGSTYIRLKDFFVFDINQVNDGLVKAIYIPTIRYGAGNTINFEMSFEHPMSAGNQTIFSDNKYTTNPVIYTQNADGDMILYLTDNDDKVSDGFLTTISVKAPSLTLEYDNRFPVVDIYSNGPSENPNGFINITNFKVYKQPNEIFALNYQLAFLPIPGRENTDFIGNEFINNNCFVKDFNYAKRNLYVVFKNEKSSNLDVKANPYFLKKEITAVGNLVLSYGFGLYFDFTALTNLEKASGDFVSWAIVDELDNVLFASNKTLDLESTISRVNIYFVTRLTRFN